MLYHADCADGFGAAYAAWKKFGSKALYIPVPPDNGYLPKEARGANVHTLDYSFPASRVSQVLRRVASLTVIDHHISNQHAAALATHSFFALDHSGAVLAWRYFHPKEPLPKLLRYIEDCDLWKFKLKHARGLSQVIRTRDFNFAVWSKLARDFENPKRLKRFVEDGKLLLAQTERTVRKLVENAEDVRFEGHRCRMVNSPVLTSEIGATLVAKGSPIGIIWSRRKDKIIVSLRSKPEGVDVSKVAEKYGGGGHKSAAGFSWKKKDFLLFQRK